jgi:hypothetical protein
VVESLQVRVSFWALDNSEKFLDGMGHLRLLSWSCCDGESGSLCCVC